MSSGTTGMFIVFKVYILFCFIVKDDSIIIELNSSIHDGREQYRNLILSQLSEHVHQSFELKCYFTFFSGLTIQFPPAGNYLPVLTSSTSWQRNFSGASKSPQRSSVTLPRFTTSRRTWISPNLTPLLSTLAWSSTTFLRKEGRIKLRCWSWSTRLWMINWRHG